MVMVRLALILAASLFFIATSLSQNLGSIEGNVYDAKTKEPLPGATIYLANTAVGMAVTNTGTFLLNQITPGKYDLIVSFIGYNTYSKAIEFEGNSVTGFSVYLDPKPIELNAVEITTKRESNRLDFSEFEKKFLGETQNSNRCDIVNRHDIFVYKEGSKLYAVSHKTIEVLNLALGYRIFYDLKEFIMDNKNKTFTIAGIPRFENLVPKNKREEKRWLRERDLAYYGSMQHFIRALKNKELKKNHFSMFDSKDVEINEERLLKGDSVIVYKGKLDLIFNPESFYDPKRRVQETILNFVGPQVMIYNNGYYQSYHDIVLTGFISSHNIADLVPLGYQPYSAME